MWQWNGKGGGFFLRGNLKEADTKDGLGQRANLSGFKEDRRQDQTHLEIAQSYVNYERQRYIGGCGLATL